MAKSITIYNSHGNKITLTDTHYVATGGEGAVYIKDNLVYKLYLDPRNKKQQAMAGLSFLSKIKHKNIAVPLDYVTDSNNEFAGLVLAVVPGDPICKMFTTTWQSANQFSLKKTANLVNEMRDIVNFVHSHNAVIVDGNEFNWLSDGTSPYLIDTDSWKFPGHNPTAIMASIQDYSSKEFTPQSDWFSWAIITFQLWAGIHPYKGGHPAYKPGQFIDRMKNRISVFNPQASVPRSVRPFGNIPLELLNWYEQVFEKGLRGAPPLAKLDVQSPTLTNTLYHAGAGLTLTKIKINGAILGHIEGFLIVKDGTSACLQLYDLSSNQIVSWIKDEEFIVKLLNNKALMVKQFGQVFAVELNDKGVVIFGNKLNPTQLLLTSGIRLWQANGRSFIVRENGTIEEIKLVQTGNGKIIASTIGSWAVNPLATKFGKGGLVQDVLGTPFIGVFTQSGSFLYKAFGLNGYAVLDVAVVDEFCVFVKAVHKQTGMHQILEFCYNTKAEFELVSATPYDEALNFAKVPSGAGVLSTTNNLTIAKARNKKIVSYDIGALTLCSSSTNLLGYFQQELFKLELR